MATDSGECPWCPNNIQTIEHLAIECRISKIIWTEAYKFLKTGQTEAIPDSIEKIFLKGTSEKAKTYRTTLWLNRQAVYKI